MVSNPSWPSIGGEERAWAAPRISPELVSAAVRRRHAGPYRAAVVPLIGDRSPNLPNEVLALAEEAAVEIARFDAELGAEVAPFASVLLRSESATSSMIENLSSGAKQIALAELGCTEKRNATEVVGNVAAMRAALELAGRLDGDAILAMHAALVGKTEPEIAGRWRGEQVWIGGDSFGPHGTAFIPPHHEHVPGLMDDLITFTRRTDLPLLPQAAIAHAQFETIHPFPDGNGRTGRALVHAMLRGHGLTRNVTVPVSAGLLTNTDAYFASLTAYRGGDPAAIVEKLAEASFVATANGRQLVSDLRETRRSWDDGIKARRGATANPVPLEPGELGQDPGLSKRRYGPQSVLARDVQFRGDDRRVHDGLAHQYVCQSPVAVTGGTHRPRRLRRPRRPTEVARARAC